MWYFYCFLWSFPLNESHNNVFPQTGWLGFGEYLELEWPWCRPFQMAVFWFWYGGMWISPYQHFIQIDPRDTKMPWHHFNMDNKSSFLTKKFISATYVCFCCSKITKYNFYLIAKLANFDKPVYNQSHRLRGSFISN